MRNYNRNSKPFFVSFNLEITLYTGYGWHIDGSYFKKPTSNGLYHIIECSSSGDTLFANMTEIFENLNPERKDFWNRLSTVSKRVGGFVHPLVYPHPLTNKPTMVFNLGMKRSGFSDLFALDYGLENEKIFNETETDKIAKSIAEELNNNHVRFEILKLNLF